MLLNVLQGTVQTTQRRILLPAVLTVAGVRSPGLRVIRHPPAASQLP